MSRRPHPKYASNDPHAGPWAVCSDCGFNWSLSSLHWQYDFAGTSVPINKGWLRCPRCITPVNYQKQLIIIPPDPPPIFNTRPETYTVDETNWLVTDDGTIIATASDQTIITSVPNPDEAAPPANESPVVEQAAVQITTEDGTVVVTESGDGNPINFEPNP